MPTPGLSYAVVRVPGSTSNIGPGFDCMGIALQIYNHVRVSRAPGGKGDVHPDHAMVSSTAQRFFEAAEMTLFPFSWSIGGEVPISRGLGSSVTLRQGILQGLNALAGDRLEQDVLFRLGCELEGHPDNASAVVYGGFACTNRAGTCLHHPVHQRLKFLLLIPDREVLTNLSRSVLPEKLSHGQAAASLANACVITAAFASQNYEALRGSFGDYLHQPYRQANNPGLQEVIAAGEGAGALGGFLSGSGSTIACLALAQGGHLQTIGTAMQRAYEVFGKSRLILAQADNAGAQTVELDA